MGCAMAGAAAAMAAARGSNRKKKVILAPRCWVGHHGAVSASCPANVGSACFRSIWFVSNSARQHFICDRGAKNSQPRVTRLERVGAVALVESHRIPECPAVEAD